MPDTADAIYNDFKDEMRSQQQFKTDGEYRGKFKVFYSHVHRYPVMVLGLNPGGNPNDPNSLHEAADGVYPKGVHDYEVCRNKYDLAAKMYDLLEYACRGMTNLTVADIPKSNLIFKRSTRGATLVGSESKWLCDCAPYVRRLFALVKPKLIVFELGANKTRNMLSEADLIVPTSWVEGDSLYKQGKRGNSAYWVSGTAIFTHSPRNRVVFNCINHPTGWTWWDSSSWGMAKEAVRRDFICHLG